MPTPTHLTTGSDTANVTTYTTASISPGANRLVLVAVMASVGTGTGPTMSVTGCGLTWEQVTQTVAAVRTLYLFRGLGAAPTAGALTITAGAALTSALWSVTEFDGVDTTGTNGSGAIVQAVNARPASASSVSVPFGTAIATDSSTFGGVAVAVQELPTPGAGWTQAGSTSQSAPTSGLLGEYAAVGQQNITASWTTSAASFIVGAEVKAAPAGGALNRTRIGDATVNAIRVGDSTVSKVYVGDAQVWP